MGTLRLRVFHFLAIFTSFTICSCVNATEDRFVLYNSSNVGISILTKTNFNSTLFTVIGEDGSATTDDIVWFVQFYNSWCGHCQRFAPSWKFVANKTLAWSNYIRMAVMDCSEKENAPVCNHYEVQSYPTMSFFPPKSKAFVKGKNFVGPHTNLVYLGMLDYLKEIGFPSENMPISLADLADVWKAIPLKIDDIALIIEDSESILGSDVFLSVLKDVKFLTVRRVTSINRPFLLTLGEGAASILPQLWFIGRDGGKSKQRALTGKVDIEDYVLTIFKKDDDIADAKDLPRAVRIQPNYLPPADEKASNTLMKGAEKDRKLAPLIASADISDLVSAIIYMFSMEVSSHSIIKNTELDALSHFVKSMVDFIPFPAQSRDPLVKISSLLKKSTSVSSSEILEIFRNSGFDVEKIPTKWTNCAGSQSGRRGFPCSLWMLFHTLTVNAYEKHLSIGRADVNAMDKNSGVLESIFGYVKNFFSCAECRENFMREADGLRAQTISMTEKEAIFWLWRMHNGVNRRLAGDITEDLQYPKIQFPSAEQCSTCRISSNADNTIWDQEEILKFLKHFYGVKAISRQVVVVQDPEHRKLVFPATLPLVDFQTNSASLGNSTSAVKIYLIGVVLVGVCYAGYRQIERWRRKTVSPWDSYSHPRVKWM